MVTFQVNDMTCGHCASAISRAVALVDKDARLDIRIQQKLVRVSSNASMADLAEAIQDAGYTPREVQNEPALVDALPVSRGCGCGCATPKTVPVKPGQEIARPRSSCCG